VLVSEKEWGDEKSDDERRNEANGGHYVRLGKSVREKRVEDR